MLYDCVFLYQISVKFRGKGQEIKMFQVSGLWTIHEDQRAGGFFFKLQILGCSRGWVKL